MWGDVKSHMIGAILGALVVAAGAAIWGALAEGGLVKSLGGATSSELAEVRQQLDTHPRELTCEALVSEEFQKRPTCNSGYQMTQWCSGDCNADDAQVTLCCDFADH